MRQALRGTAVIESIFSGRVKGRLPPDNAEDDSLQKYMDEEWGRRSTSGLRPDHYRNDNYNVPRPTLDAVNWVSLGLRL